MDLSVAIVGPTATGKSSLAIELARSLGCVEIVSVDSMAVYREMDLATAKPSAALREEFPHHLIDLLDPSDDCSVSYFQFEARAAIAGIHARGKVPLLVGGTGLYHRSVIDNLEIPGQWPEIRRQLDDQLLGQGSLAEMYQRLESVDPQAASRIEPENGRRIARALEVIEGSGRLFSSFGPGLTDYPESSVTQIGIDRELDLLDQAVETRVDEWVEAGLLDEMRGLAARADGLSRTARQAIGYRECLDWLELDEDRRPPFAVPIAATVARSRSLLRRQRSWFRRDPRISWAESTDQAYETASRAISGIAQQLK